VEALRSVEVEDLGPARLELERRRLMARLAASRAPLSRRGRLALSLGLAGAAVVVAAAALLVLVPGIGGSADSLVTLSGVWRLEPGDAISRGLPVRVEDGGRARLVLPGGTSIEASSGTRMTLTAEDGSAIRLDGGHAVIAVAPRAGSGMFRAVTPDAEILVHGTVFSVTVDPGRDTTVRLHEGEIRLVCGGRSVTMQPGHQVVAGATGLLSLVAYGADGHGFDANLAPHVVPPPPLRPGPALAAADGRRDGIHENGDGDVLDDPAEDDPVFTNGPAPRPPAMARSAARGREPETVYERVAEQQRMQHHEEAVALTDDAWKRSAPSDVDLLFRRARSLGRLGRWAEAVEVYGRIAGMDRERRGEAFYLAADASSRSGDFAAAVALADRAIAAGGPNADHAWSVKFGALTGMERYGDAAAAAAAYLASHPAGAHVGEAHFVRGTGLRLERRWGEAARAYGSFLERGEGAAAIREDGRFYHGYCLLMSGSREQGAAALETYLVDYPYGRHARQARVALGR